MRNNFANSKKAATFAFAFDKKSLERVESASYGPFVYRLGRKIFILERGVRFSYGLPSNKQKN